MSQAEIAGGRVNLPDELPAKGRRLRDFGLRSVHGRYIHLSDYRGRYALVLVFADDRQSTAELLSELAGHYAEFKNEEARVLAIAQLPYDDCSRIKERLNLPYPMLLDGDGRIHREVGASDPHGSATAAVYITDRYAEVFGVYRTCDCHALPTVAEILNWLEFINNQCPECEPPEWPA